MTIKIRAEETCVRCGAPVHQYLLRRKLLSSPWEVFPVCHVCAPDALCDLMTETPPALKKVTRFWVLPGTAERSSN